MTGSNRLPVLAEEIKRAHIGVMDAAKTVAERAIEAGNALIEAKSLVKHGEWLPFLKEHCALPERTAQLYMKIARLDLEPATVADLGGHHTLDLPNVGVDARDDLSQWHSRIEPRR